ncbi:hypothetical protein BDW71DRAFT_175847 [Aspergillus fruticulosus]
MRPPSSALVLVDATIQRSTPGLKFTQASTYRQDILPSRAEALQKFKSRLFYQAWDNRLFEKWTQSRFREPPTPLYPITDHNGLGDVS